MRYLASLWCLLIAAMLTGCAAAPLRADLPAADESSPAFYVVRRAQHTGIAVAARGWPDEALIAAFPGAAYLEFGWGDAAYYPAERKSLLMLFDAAFTPSSSVMSVVGLPSLTAGRPDGIERVPVTPGEWQALVASLAEAFASPEPTGAARRVAEGELRFYPARGSFYFFRMCNHWTVERLRAAGCEVGSLPVITAGRALREARNCAAVRASR